MRHLFILLLSCFTVFAFGQSRPKVGLALSGGGAKCMAQLGALRTIEQSGIKIDYISGTSMGAVIGAMYAMGYTVDEIEATLSTVNWDELLNNEIPKNRLPYLNRDDEKYILNVYLEDGKLSLPKAFNHGNYMLKVLSYLTMRNHDVTDFSQLSIPFLCMATDLETGESVAFEEGNLTDALRASVAFPSIFSPYEIDGKLYVDGGVRNNLPIAILKDEKNMDFVIAIDVQGKLYNKEDINSIVEVLEQVGSFQNALYFKEQKGKADIMITPAVNEFDITDYADTDTIIKLGTEATLPFLEEMKKIASRQGKIKIETKKGTATPLALFPVDTAIVTGVKPQEAKLITGKLKLRKPGMYKLTKLDRGLDLLYGSNKYDKANFNYSHKDSTNTVYIQVKKKSTRHTLGFGVHYDDDFSIALLANYTMRDALLLNSIFKLDIAISENPRGSISWTFERGYVPALGIRGTFNKFQPRIYDQGDVVSQFIFLTYNADLFIHSTIGNNYTIGTGLKWDNIDISESIDVLGLERQQNQYLIYHAFLDFYSLDRSFKPTKGFCLKSKLNVISDLSVAAFENVTSLLDLRLKTAFSFSNKVGMNVGALGAVTIGPNPDFPYQIFVGGLGQNYINFTYPFVGYRHMEIFGRNFASVNADLFYEFFPNHFISLEANAGKLETTVDELFSSDIILDGYGLSYGYNSPLGPLQLTVMASSNHAKIFTYISLGFWF